MSKKKTKKAKSVEEVPTVPTPPKVKRLKNVKTDEVELEVYECVCGVRVGIDASRTKVRQMIAYCPICGKRIESDWDKD
jgi:hypothetical protein